jgi:hypothetical protein
VDARGHPLTHLDPDAIATIQCLPGVDMDRCANPGLDCCFGIQGVVVEDHGPHAVDFRDGDAGGEFGTLAAGGKFQALPAAQRRRATHYRASGHRWGTFGFTAVFDDTTQAQEPPGDNITTYDDPPSESSPVWLTIGPRIE